MVIYMKNKFLKISMQQLILIYTCIIFGIYRLSVILDQDYFLHFYTGKYILDNKVIPRYDIFSWYKVDVRWYTPSWAFCILIYILKHIVVIILFSVLVMVLLRILTKMFFKNDKELNILKYGFFVLLSYTILTYASPRPATISFLFFAVTINILFEFINEEKFKTKKLYLLPIIQLLWVNFHGASSALMYILIFVVLILNVLPNFLIGSIEHVKLSKSKFRTLLITLLVVLGVSLINPNTYEFFYFVFSNFTNKELSMYISELKSPVFGSIVQIIIYLLPLFLIGLTFLINKTKKFKLYDLVLIILFMMMYFKGDRYYPYFVISSIWFLGKYLSIDLLILKVSRINTVTQKMIINLVFIFIIILLLIFNYKLYDGYKNPLATNIYFSSSLEEKLIEIRPKRIANYFTQGSPLTDIFSKNETGSKVFINSLAEIYIKSEIFFDAVDLYNINVSPDEIIDKYRFDYILTGTNSSLYSFLELQKEEYEISFRDAKYTIFKVLRYAD